jgi:hypothetical protein
LYVGIKRQARQQSWLARLSLKIQKQRATPVVVACPVCQQVLNANDAVSLSCTHQYHLGCLQQRIIALHDYCLVCNAEQDTGLLVAMGKAFDLDQTLTHLFAEPTERRPCAVRIVIKKLRIYDVIHMTSQASYNNTARKQQTLYCLVI